MTAAHADAAARAAERVARLSYSRVLSILARAWTDVAAAEDALSDAFRRALETWPNEGVPDRPEAWLLVAARRRLADAARSRAVRRAAEPTLRMLADEALADRPPTGGDARLTLMFVCAHPAIDEAARAPLMLQTILGLDASRVASAFLIAPATMAQRLVRAKARIREAGVPYMAPEPEEIAPRSVAVREAIYAAYCIGWDAAFSDVVARSGLAAEAIWLARLLAELTPNDPECLGLLALLLYCEARRGARRTPDGRFAPLREQDTRTWDAGMLAEAERLLRAAARFSRPARFQLEAAIQSAQVQERLTGQDLSCAILALHDRLLTVSPTIAAALGHAAAVAAVSGPGAGIAELDELPAGHVNGYQAFWALRGELLRQLGRQSEAVDALERAAGLTEDPAARAFLLGRRPHLSARN